MGRITTRLRIAAWDEQPIAEYDDGSKITRATIELSEPADGLESGSVDSLMYYRPDGTSHYVNVMRLTATLDGRAGTFVLSGAGAFDGITASGTSDIVVGSATGDLVGISGSCTSISTHADYPYMPLDLSYELVDPPL
jgi:hypothetical protein